GVGRGCGAWGREQAQAAAASAGAWAAGAQGAASWGVAAEGRAVGAASSAAAAACPKECVGVACQPRAPADTGRWGTPVEKLAGQAEPDKAGADSPAPEPGAARRVSPQG